MHEAILCGHPCRICDYHLKQPTQADFEKQLAINVEYRFPGVFVSLDYMHYKWKNCPIAWEGDFGYSDGKKSIILKVIADESLHIWHVFFGLHGFNNDLNVLDHSPLVHNTLIGVARDMTFIVNGQEYDRYYLLANEIYPQWSCFVQSIYMPQDEKRCFEVLQSRYAIIRNSCKRWIMFACCIFYNMILEDECSVSRLQNILVGLGDSGMPLYRGFLFEELMTTQ